MEVFMKVREIIIFAFALSVFFGSLWGCGGKEERGEEETEAGRESESQPSKDISEINEPGETTKEAEKEDAERLQKQVEEVRSTFMSLQKVCEANDIEGYLDFWDYETKKEIDGRELSVEERRELKRKSLTRGPGTLQDIANAKIEYITVDTSQAEKIMAMSGTEIEGTMMLVRTTGLAYLFHETDKGWKLFTVAPSEYFR
jgi:hypothetical protein